MATGTRSKRITPQQMKAKLNARVDQQAGHLAALVNHVDSISEAKVSAAKEIEELKQLGLTLAEIEEATGISSHRLRAFTRRGRELIEETDNGDVSDEGVEDSGAVRAPGRQGHDEDVSSISGGAVGGSGADETESERP